ncbi:deoxyribonuclease IV [Dactylosporangium sp. AC04546]|uniref:deoxyribonuclease IV n=1 Tax=Dactylosporangium sp. AC04546 TaxID=2862460 RepID=UPI001EDD0308|nr:deoxyribonuclease IV [Dactylosporangium sp. AC04546]WVK82166.1 deoxyribonuclease IV [Dactylosporangium sp. AC04546]
MTTARIGGHAPAAGGLAKAALRYIDRTGATAVQVYVSNPRGWALTAGDPKQDEAFLKGCAEQGVTAYVHAALLVNLGSPTEATVANSLATLEHALRRGKEIGAHGVVFHAGSAVDAAHTATAFATVRAGLTPLLDRAEREGWPPLLVEPSAGGGRSLASRVEHLADYLAAVDHHPHLGVCFDTCHAWAAGHDLAGPGGMTATLDTLVAAVGEHRLRLIHANDSKDACGSLRDRHESLGKGTIGAAAFTELLAHPATSGVPLVVETPSGADAAEHAADIALLRAAAQDSSAGSTASA